MASTDKFGETLKESAREFLIGEFQAPMDIVKENDMSMYDYRSTLVFAAYYILGGRDKGAQNEIPRKDEGDDEDLNES